MSLYAWVPQDEDITVSVITRDALLRCDNSWFAASAIDVHRFAVSTFSVVDTHGPS